MAEKQLYWTSPTEWSQWSERLAAGLHGRSAWRLPVLMLGMLFAQGRRTVTTWLRAAGVSDDYQDYDYFLAALGRKTEKVARQLVRLILRQLPLPERVLLVIDDSPTERYGRHVEGAAIHHNPTPGPADQNYLYGHIWVTLSLALRHPRFGAIGLPLRALLYVRRETSVPSCRGWRFATKLQLAARLVEWLAPLLKGAGKQVWIVVDGGYTKRPFLQRALATGATVVGRLRKDAALRSVDVPERQRRRGRPRKYGKEKISLAKRAGQRRGWQQLECTLYRKQVTKTYKTFLATYAPAGGLIRVVLVKEDHGCYAFFCTDPDATVQELLEAFSDRASIEQDFHDTKEVWGAGQQQVCNIWSNVAVYNLNLWMHTLVELWAWDKPHEELCDRRDSPWDDPERRPSPIAARPCAARLCITNYRPLPLPVACHEKSFSSQNNSWRWPDKVRLRSGDFQKVQSRRHRVRRSPFGMRDVGAIRRCPFCYGKSLQLGANTREMASTIVITTRLRNRRKSFCGLDVARSCRRPPEPKVRGSSPLGDILTGQRLTSTAQMAWAQNVGTECFCARGRPMTMSFRSTAQRWRRI
jgi:hypothetical protein